MSDPDVDGVEVGTEVRLAGVRVGRVTDISLNPQTYMADAVIRVPEDVLLPADSAALIQSDGLLGGAYIQLQPGGSMDNLAPGDEIEDVQGAVSLISLMMKFVDSQASDGEGDSEAEKAWMSQVVDQVKQSAPMHRYATINEQAAPILFLASDEASYITGTILPVAGGDTG